MGNLAADAGLCFTGETKRGKVIGVRVCVRVRCVFVCVHMQDVHSSVQVCAYVCVCVFYMGGTINGWGSIFGSELERK